MKANVNADETRAIGDPHFFWLIKEFKKGNQRQFCWHLNKKVKGEHQATLRPAQTKRTEEKPRFTMHLILK